MIGRMREGNDWFSAGLQESATQDTDLSSPWVRLACICCTVVEWTYLGHLFSRCGSDWMLKLGSLL
jgi:hypothetical protein